MKKTKIIPKKVKVLYSRIITTADVNTEADAMSGANKQDWGNYSHIMRAAFHHEKISAARKTNRELLEIKHPIGGGLVRHTCPSAKANRFGRRWFI